MAESNSGANWGQPPAYGGTFGSDGAEEVGALDRGGWSGVQAGNQAGNPVGEQAAKPAQGAGFMNILAAGLSLVLLVGMGVWGYRLAVRDVTGVPVVRALDGPMRIQPDDPGGEEAAYQGFSVNAVQGMGGAAAPADTLALAPRNTGLAPEDIEPAATPSVSAAPVAPVAAPVAPAPIAEAAPAQPAPETDAQAEMLALADQISAGVEPLSQVTQTSAGGVEATLRAADQVVAEVVAAVQVIPASVPGLARSPRPAPRPEGLAALVTSAAPTASEPSNAVVELAAAEIPVGTQLVQLGAFDSPEVARAEWDRLAARFEDYFGAKSRVVMQATSGGRKFWRLRASGFENLSDARRFCAVLATARAPCIPVVTR